MTATDNPMELFAELGWSFRAFRPALEEGGDGWAIAVEKGCYRIIVFADNYERALDLAAKVVEERTRVLGHRLIWDQPW